VKTPSARQLLIPTARAHRIFPGVVAALVLVLSACAGDPAGVTPMEPPTASAGGPYTGQEGAPIAFDGTASSGTGNLSYLWTFGDGNTGTGPQPVHTYVDDGVYTVVLTVTDSDGVASDPNTTTVTVENVAPAVSLILSTDAVLVGVSVSATGAFSDPGALDSPWDWELDWGDGTRETGSAASRSTPIAGGRVYATPGTYTVRLSVTDKDGATGVAERTLVVSPLPAEDVPVRIVTFGDSNTDGGWDGANPNILVRSYISRMPLRLSPSDPHDPRQLAGKIEAGWQAVRVNPITAVNHGIGGTTTGGGGFGGSDRRSTGSPNSRTRVNGVTRFEAEVLGHDAPSWHGGEPTNEAYPDGPITRSNAFEPGPYDFAYVAMGTNDAPSGITTAQTIQNLQWMVDGWIDAGLPPSHFLLATLPPREPQFVGDFPMINEAIRGMGAAHGIHVIDLAAYTSDDDGLTWRAEDLHVGDQVHYTEAVRDWIAAQVVAHMRIRVPGQETAEAGTFGGR
jgi:PKD repeat protein